METFMTDSTPTFNVLAMLLRCSRLFIPCGRLEWDSMTHGNLNGFLSFFSTIAPGSPEICCHNANVDSSSKSLMPYSIVNRSANFGMQSTYAAQKPLERIQIRWPTVQWSTSSVVYFLSGFFVAFVYKSDDRINKLAISRSLSWQ